MHKLKKHHHISIRVYKNILQICFFLTVVIVILPSFSAQINQEKPEKTNRTFENILYNMTLKSLQRLMCSPSLSVCAIKNNEIAWYGGYGFAKVYKRTKPTRDTIYPIGSISKTITTTALLQLYEKELIDLDEDVNTYLDFDLRNPYYPSHKITIRMLLSHRASIYDYEFFTKRGMILTTLQSGIPSDIESWLEETLVPDGNWYHRKYWHWDYAPGEEACYSNTGFLIIGHIVEKVSGMSINEYCQEHIFTPLEMYNTSYQISDLNPDLLATPYIKYGGLFLPLPPYDTKGFSSIGGVRSSVEDLSHFLIAHMNNGRYKDTRILKESTMELMHNCSYVGCRLISPLNRCYGLGWWSMDRFGRTIEGHGGMVPGGSTFMMMDSTESIGYIIMTNQFDIFGFFHSLELFFEAQSRSIIGELVLQRAENI